MRILLSAYACEPGKGSEPSVGWHWATVLARQGHEVHVITRANNAEAIEAEYARDAALPPVHFHYYDLPAALRRWKRGGRGIRTYYVLWQVGILSLARRLHDRHRFDLVHHITFGVFRQPSFLGLLEAPFVFGPVGGGETAPRALRKGYPFRGWVLDAIRDGLNRVSLLDPVLRYAYRKADLIFAKTHQTKAALPRSVRHKTHQHLEIGIDVADEKPARRPRHGASALRVLYVGRFLYWKGMHLGLQAFARLREHHPTATLTMIGKGPDESHWRALAHRLGLDDAIEWIGWVDHRSLHGLYRAHDVFLFPSLHDSSGNVVLEAFANGLPVVCLDLGGPAALVDATCGCKIAVAGKTEAQVVSDLADALGRLCDKAVRQSLSDGAWAKAQISGWDHVVRSLYETVEAILGIASPNRAPVEAEVNAAHE